MASHRWGGRLEYWQLGQYHNLSVKEMKAMLAERHYDTGSIADKERLRRCLQRSDLGLLSYVKYKNDELRELITIRGIKTEFIKGNKGQRYELIDALEYEDNHREFRNFTNLPAELRTRVYEYYMADFTEPLTAPKQPPLTLTSGLVRKESLPLFYSTCIFNIALIVPQKYLSGVYSRGTKLRLWTSCRLWLHETMAENLADVQRIHVTCVPSLGWLSDDVLNIQLDIRATPIEILIEGDASKLSYSESMLLSNLKQAMLAVFKREGRWKPSKDDFLTFRNAIERAMVE